LIAYLLIGCRKFLYCIAAFHVAVEDARTIPELDLAAGKSHLSMRLVGSRPQKVGMLKSGLVFQLHKRWFVAVF